MNPKRWVCWPTGGCDYLLEQFYSISPCNYRLIMQETAIIPVPYAGFCNFQPLSMECYIQGVFEGPLVVCRRLHHLQWRGLPGAGGPHCEWKGVSEVGPAIPSSAHLPAGEVCTFSIAIVKRAC